MAPADRGQPSEQDTGGSAGHDELASLFSSFARTVQMEGAPHATLVEIVRAAIELVPGCDEGSISVVLGRNKVTSEAASGDLPRQVDALQERLRQGPCLDAACEHSTVRVADMSTEKRWPEFTLAALECGAAGMLALQLYVEGDDLGALNLFSRQAGAFTDESEHVGLMFAAHAAVAYASARQSARMARGLGLARGLPGPALVERCEGTARQWQQVRPAVAAAVTLSIGVAAVDERGGRMALQRADQAMYRAKAGGRNRVVLAVPQDDDERPAP